ncbi:hypothetical protein [Lichenibacterium ramalinae]|jgi:hypothetical protein|uniref:Uncharacterized protein n=1 Tax=Lichenibacterium ramalinae TaxID=2316527 RepID=A0A4Q2RF60_9HYPH|nr:hypothetical protein [Lichenibacterium ramalinae]RYB06665.1 hypothetical protein D3272_04860 [Lichenibacterium ramalinae]
MVDAVMQSRDDADGTALVVMPVGVSSDRVVDFSSSMKDRLLQNAAEGANAGKRDWSSALDLVSEAFEAIRMADERAAASEEYQAEMMQRHADQVKVMETRIVAAEKRADAAENRAKVAEGWLSKFHDTIIDEFQRTFASRHGER